MFYSRCPSGILVGALNLKPLSKPKGGIWFSKVLCGDNTLQKIILELMKLAGFTGYFTSHSLFASATTLLFEHGVGKKLVMR